VPRGTHDWKKFLHPKEIISFLSGTPLEAEAPIGVSYRPFQQEWVLSNDTDVNYMVVAKHPIA